jgi:hypothetical protein
VNAREWTVVAALAAALALKASSVIQATLAGQLAPWLIIAGAMMAVAWWSADTPHALSMAAVQVVAMVVAGVVTAAALVDLLAPPSTTRLVAVTGAVALAALLGVVVGGTVSARRAAGRSPVGELLTGAGGWALVQVVGSIAWVHAADGSLLRPAATTVAVLGAGILLLNSREPLAGVTPARQHPSQW